MSDEEGDKYRVAEPMGLPEAPYHQDVVGNSA